MAYVQALRDLLARNIRRIAEARGISLGKVADFAGISRPSFFRALQGKEAMSIDRIGKIANALECQPHELLLDKPTDDNGLTES